jgi:hypothetical protein
MPPMLLLLLPALVLVLLVLAQPVPVLLLLLIRFRILCMVLLLPPLQLEERTQVPKKCERELLISYLLHGARSKKNP